MKITKQQEKIHEKLTVCHDCNCAFTEENKKAHHHEHINGQYISTICNNCNLKYKYKYFLPIYIHNNKGYDGHFLINSLNKYGYKHDDIITCIPSTEEKYISYILICQLCVPALPGKVEVAILGGAK